MRKFLTVVVIGSMVALGMPSAAFAASGKLHSQQIQFGTINGTVRSANGDPLPNHKVRARDAAGNIVGQATSSAAGSYSIAGLQPGNYLIELVNSSGQVIGVSSPVSLGTGETLSGVIVTATASSKGAVAAAAGGGFSLFGLGTAASIGVIAAAGTAAIVGIVAATNSNNNASPSK